MTKKFMLSFAAAALMVASAAEKHNITLFQPSLVNGTELAPGDYRMELDGDKLVISKGKQNPSGALGPPPNAWRGWLAPKKRSRSASDACSMK